jgi:hypothetical protein
LWEIDGYPQKKSWDKFEPGVADLLIPGSLKRMFAG